MQVWWPKCPHIAPELTSSCSWTFCRGVLAAQPGSQAEDEIHPVQLSPISSFLTPRARMQILYPTPHFASVGASYLMLPSGKIAPAPISAGFAEQPTQQGGLSARPVCVASPHHSPGARSATPVQLRSGTHLPRQGLLTSGLYDGGLHP